VEINQELPLSPSISLGKEAFTPIINLSEILSHGRRFHVKAPQETKENVKGCALVLLMNSTGTDYTRTSFRINAMQATYYEQKKMQ